MPEVTRLFEPAYRDHEKVPVPPDTVEVRVTDCPEFIEIDVGCAVIDSAGSRVTDTLEDVAIGVGVAAKDVPVSVNIT